FLPDAREGLEQRGLSGVPLAQDQVQRAGLHLEVEVASHPARALGDGESLGPESGPPPDRLGPGRAFSPSGVLPDRFRGTPRAHRPSPQSGRTLVPARPSIPSAIFPGDVIRTERPAPRTNSIAAWILG